MVELAVIVAVITGLGQVVKEFIPSKFMPLASLVLGVVGGLAFVEGTLQVQIFAGLAMGLAACGLFDVAAIPQKMKK